VSVLLVCLLYGAAAKFEVEGVDMLLFNDDGQISTLVQFDMQVRRGGGGYHPAGTHTIVLTHVLAPIDGELELHGVRWPMAWQCHTARCTLTVDVLPRSCVMQDYSRLLRDNAPVGSK
jgi:hypothetical protein